MFPGIIPSIACPGLITPAQFGPIKIIFSFFEYRRIYLLTLIISCDGMPSVIATQTLIPASAASIAESAAKAGGEINVIQEDAQAVLITAKGENAGLHGGLHEALEQKVDIKDLTPKQVHAAIFGLLAKNYGYDLLVDEMQNNNITLKIITPEDQHLIS